MALKKGKTQELPQTTSSDDLQDNQSGSLRGFRETLKDVLEDITTLEVNTIVVSNISTDKFDARKFYEDVLNSITYKIEDVLQDRYIELSQKAEALRKKGAAISSEEHSSYNSEVSDYEKLKSKFDKYKQDTLAISQARFEQEQKYYKDVQQQFSKLDFSKNINQTSNRLDPDAATTRFLRKLWEAEQTIIHNDRIYAQTRFQLDGDLSNRFIGDLFGFDNSKLTSEKAQLILKIHNQAVENAESQWSKLINTVVDLVTKLIPYRK